VAKFTSSFPLAKRVPTPELYNTIGYSIILSSTSTALRLLVRPAFDPCQSRTPPLHPKSCIRRIPSSAILDSLSKSKVQSIPLSRSFSPLASSRPTPHHSNAGNRIQQLRWSKPLPISLPLVQLVDVRLFMGGRSALYFGRRGGI
jgi:hypothetical protein